jgi:hypothetical protein
MEVVVLSDSTVTVTAVDTSAVSAAVTTDSALAYSSPYTALL